MSNILDGLGDFANLSVDVMLTTLAALIDAISEGTEFTAEQIDKLAELEAKLAAKVNSLR